MEQIEGLAFQPTYTSTTKEGLCGSVRINVLRVGERLQNYILTFDEKHPMLRPAAHEVTQLIIENKHRQFMRFGPQALLASTRKQFWTIKGKQLALTPVRRCIICCRAL